MQLDIISQWEVAPKSVLLAQGIIGILVIMNNVIDDTCSQTKVNRGHSSQGYWAFPKHWLMGMQTQEAIRLAALQFAVPSQFQWSPFHPLNESYGGEKIAKLPVMTQSHAGLFL